MNSILPPIAAVHPHSLTYHGDERIDPYYWLRDDTRSDPAVLDYLQAENGYTEAMLRPTEALQRRYIRKWSIASCRMTARCRIT